MTFEEDLTKRRIDVAAFAASDPERFAAWQRMYAQTHPNSFYMAVKMVINDVRRRFWLAEAVKPAAAPVTDAPAKPAIRRATIPGASKPATPATSEPVVTKPITETPGDKPNPPKARPVIRRPAPASAETPPVVTPENKLGNAPEVPAEAPKPPRPRPVIRKPAATPEKTTEASFEQEKIVREETNADLPYHANPDPEAAAPSPPRPRPVIKRPVALQKPTDQPEIQKPAGAADPNGLGESPVQTESPGTETAADTPKPPRPRPVFKRPTVAPASVAENNSEVPNPVVASEPNPIAATPEATLPAEPTGATAPASEPAAEVAKPPRPRPIMRRPTPPAAAPTAPTQPNPEMPTPAAPEPLASASAQPEPAQPEVTEEPRQPPRPRPVFKRPTKPNEPEEQ